MAESEQQERQNTEQPKTYLRADQLMTAARQEAEQLHSGQELAVHIARASALESLLESPALRAAQHSKELLAWTSTDTLADIRKSVFGNVSTAVETLGLPTMLAGQRAMLEIGEQMKSQAQALQISLSPAFDLSGAGIDIDAITANLKRERAAMLGLGAADQIGSLLAPAAGMTEIYQSIKSSLGTGAMFGEFAGTLHNLSAGLTSGLQDALKGEGLLLPFGSDIPALGRIEAGRLWGEPWPSSLPARQAPAVIKREPPAEATAGELALFAQLEAAVASGALTAVEALQEVSRRLAPLLGGARPGPKGSEWTQEQVVTLWCEWQQASQSVTADRFARDRYMSRAKMYRLFRRFGLKTE